jgi:hypothetical protein
LLQDPGTLSFFPLGFLVVSWVYVARSILARLVPSQVLQIDNQLSQQQPKKDQRRGGRKFFAINQKKRAQSSKVPSTLEPYLPAFFHLFFWIVNYLFFASSHHHHQTRPT